MRSKLTATALALLSLTVIAVAQNRSGPLRDVVIKRTNPVEKGSLMPTQVGNGLLAKNVTLKDVLFFCYGAPYLRTLQLKYLIVDGPEWLDMDHFDFEATPDDGSPISLQEMQNAVISLLEQRFKLRAHRETREMPVLNLVVGNGDLKMKMSEDQTPPAHVTGGYDMAHDRRPLPRGALTSSITDQIETVVGNAVPISALVPRLQSRSDRVVFDKTGLTGLFDFTFQYSTRDVLLPSSSRPQPAMLRGIEELGLKLELATAPLEVLVIDHAEKPDAN